MELICYPIFIQPRDTGILSERILFAMNTSKTNRERKTQFVRIKQLLQLSGAIEPGVELLSVGLGCTSVGEPVIIAYIRDEEKDNES